MAGVEDVEVWRDRSWSMTDSRLYFWQRAWYRGCSCLAWLASVVVLAEDGGGDDVNRFCISLAAMER